MKKSILAGLLMFSLTASSQHYTGDSTYCLPLSKARLLVADALRNRVNEDLNNTFSHRIELLESEKLSVYKAFTNLLNIEQNKFQLQKEITDHQKEVSKSYKEENTHLKKQVRRLKWQRAAGLGVLALVSAVILIDKF